MLSYCCYCHGNTKDINTGPMIRKSMSILNKTKRYNCNHKKSKHYKLLSTQNLNYKMLTYCAKCRKKTKNLDPKILETKNNKLIT